MAQLNFEFVSSNQMLQNQDYMVHKEYYTIGVLKKTITHKIDRCKFNNNLITEYNQISLKKFIGHDRRVKKLTGFESYDMMEAMFLDAKPYIPEEGAIPKFQIFIMTLAKVKQNLSIKFLAKQFKLSRSTITRLFHDTLAILYRRLYHFVVWPRNDEPQMAPAFFTQLFGKHRRFFIVHCFELYCVDQVYKWNLSQKKLKYLVCFTPNGAIVYISKAFGGRCTDKFILEHCGLIKLMHCNDIILADRRFFYEKLAMRKRSRLIMAACINFSGCLIPIEMMSRHRQLGSMSFFIGRVISRLRRKFIFLQQEYVTSTLNLYDDEVIYIDYIVRIACAIYNISLNVDIDIS